MPEQNEVLQELAALREELAENTRKTDLILKGFPQGDPDGHRRYHEEVMQQMAERRKLRQELLTHLLKASSWPALVGVCYVLWRYFKTQLLNG
jgi:hypothetical protein